MSHIIGWLIAVLQMKSEEISQKTIRDLLTGRLDESTTDQLDELSVTSSEFAERVAVEQYELIDDWVTGRLEKADSTAFEILLARSPALREKAEISRTLAAAAHRAAVVERLPEPSFLARIFGGMPRLAYGIAGLAVLIGIAGLAALLLRREGVPEISQIGTTTAVASPSASPVQPQVSPSISATVPANIETPTPDNTERPKSSPTPTRRSPAPFVAVLLAPPTRGSAVTQSVKLEEGVKFLNLTLQTEARSSDRFTVEIGDGPNAVDWRSPAVRGRSANGRTVVSVRVPATRLKKGLRNVRLLDAGSEIIDEHLLRIDR